MFQDLVVTLENAELYAEQAYNSNRPVREMFFFFFFFNFLCTVVNIKVKEQDKIKILALCVVDVMFLFFPLTF